MGMYTEFEFRAQIKPEYVAELAKIAQLEEDTPNSYVDYLALGYTHAFFHSSRCGSITCYGGGNGYRGGYVVSRPGFHVEGDVLTIATELKNYDNTIEHFLDWIGPKVVLETVKGRVRYEERYDSEDMLVIENGKIVRGTNPAFSKDDPWDSVFI